MLGPMVYSAVYWSRVDDEAVSAMGFDDSKALTAEQRANLFRKVHEVGWQASWCAECRHRSFATFGSSRDQRAGLDKLWSLYWTHRHNSQIPACS